MSNLNPEKEYTHLEDVFEFVLQQFKKDLYTAMPGIIQSYNATTKRATVLPALNRILTDGTSRQFPVLQDIPVIFPAGGGYTVTMPLAKGDAVMLLFSQRSLANFKLVFANAMPSDGVMTFQDAVALPGFGALNITPASMRGATLQGNNGANAIIVESNKVQLKLGNTVSITANPGNIVLNVGGSTLTLSAGSLISNVPINAPAYAGADSAAANMNSGINMNGQSITEAGDVTTVSGVSLSSHIHSGVESGNQNSGAPVA